MLTTLTNISSLRAHQAVSSCEEASIEWYKTFFHKIATHENIGKPG